MSGVAELCRERVRVFTLQIDNGDPEPAMMAPHRPHERMWHSNILGLYTIGIRKVASLL